MVFSKILNAVLLFITAAALLIGAASLSGVAEKDDSVTTVKLDQEKPTTILVESKPGVVVVDIEPCADGECGVAQGNKAVDSQPSGTTVRRGIFFRWRRR